jgi:hypothetical protein
MSPVKRLVLVSIMLWLPLQGAVAASMSLCAKEKDIMRAEPDAQAASNTVMLPCTQAKDTTAQSDLPAITDIEQHHTVSHDSNQGATGEITTSLPCESAPCHSSCGATIPSASSTTILTGGDSYAVLFNTRFTSLVPEQLQRPPLA